MRCLLSVASLALILAHAPDACGFEPMPADRLARALVVLDYEHPWPGLDIHRGRARAGFPLPGGLRCGARVGATLTPTVRETGAGAWIRVRQALLVAVDRVDVGVDGLDVQQRTDIEAAFRLRTGPLSLGWWGRAEGIHAPVTALWRHWWVGFDRPDVEVAIGRRVVPWSSDPGWTLAVRFRLVAGVRSTLAWRAGESTLALGWSMPFARLTTTTGWTGPRAGGFGLRVEAGGR